jgi:2'-hydroxyisoflavone reductase
MRILILGGTQFVGRHITAAALAAGHTVSLLHRGRTGAHLFPEATHLRADRDGDLAVLRGGQWDTVIDVNAYLPRQVDALADALGRNAPRYVFVSSVSVYAPPAVPGYDESAPRLTLPPGPVPEDVTGDTYGPLKARCEQAATARFGPATLILRPSYVIGPHDHLDRFTYWVRRIARGGRVLAPGHPDRAIQVIDARDLAAFALMPNTGPFNLGAPPMTFGALLEAIARTVAPPGTTLTWVDPQFLLDAGESASTLPLWYAGDEDDARLNTADPAAALKAGLRLRPLAESIADVRDEPPVAQFLSPARESQLLAQWSMAE